MFCKKCGEEIGENEVFCHKCGQKVEQPAPEAEPVKSEAELEEKPIENKAASAHVGAGTEQTAVRAALKADKGLILIRRSTLIIYIVAMAIIVTQSILFMIFARGSSSDGTGILSSPEGGNSSVTKAISVENVVDKEYVIDGVTGTYTGQWENNKPNGDGQFEFSDDTAALTIDGNWSNGLPNGYCTYNVIQQGEDDFALQTYYQGNVSKGVITGNGTLQYKNNKGGTVTYSGEFMNGEPYNCTYSGTTESGAQIKGTVENGVEKSSSQKFGEELIDIGKNYVKDHAGDIIGWFLK